MAAARTSDTPRNIWKRAYGARTYASNPQYRQAIKDRSNKRYAWRAFGLAVLKKYLGCTDCGYREHHGALQWDHLPWYHKYANVAAMTGRSDARLLAEIAKCEVVCANCHYVRTQQRNLAKQGLQHA